MLPGLLSHVQALNMNEFPRRRRIQDTARAIATAVRNIKSEGSKGAVQSKDLTRLTELAVSQATGSESPASITKPLAEVRSAFVVHDHDEAMLGEVCAYLREIGIKPTVMRDEGSESYSLLQTFFDLGKQAKYAIVPLSGDDYGASLKQYDLPDVGARTLKYRARQNVILELGFFYGHLGFQNVFCFGTGGAKDVPRFRAPVRPQWSGIQSLRHHWQVERGSQKASDGARLDLTYWSEQVYQPHVLVTQTRSIRRSHSPMAPIAFPPGFVRLPVASAGRRPV